MIALTSRWPGVRVPVPGNGEWLDFFVTPMAQRFCLYWRLNDGDRLDPDVVEYGFISAHQKIGAAEAKRQTLIAAQKQMGLTA